MKRRREFIFEVSEIVDEIDLYTGKRSIVRVTKGTYMEDSKGNGQIILDEWCTDLASRKNEKNFIKKFIQKFKEVTK